MYVYMYIYLRGPFSQKPGAAPQPAPRVITWTAWRFAAVSQSFIAVEKNYKSLYELFACTKVYKGFTKSKLLKVYLGADGFFI